MLRGIRQWRLAERGFSNAVVMILAMPLIMGMMGYVFDNGRLVYLTQVVQSRAEGAVQSAVNRAETNPQTSYVTLVNAPAAARTIYCTNTANMRPVNLSSGCNPAITQIGAGSITAAQLCVPITATSVKYGLRLTAQETIPTMFMHIIGIKTFTLTNVSADALLRGRNC
jgi:hypothetical protein